MPQIAFIRKTQLNWSGCPIIWRVPGLMGGVPVIRGMRITPETILTHWESGMDFAEIAEQFDVDINDMQTIVEFANSHGLSTADTD